MERAILCRQLAEAVLLELQPILYMPRILLVSEDVLDAEDRLRWNLVQLEPVLELEELEVVPVELMLRRGIFQLAPELSALEWDPRSLRVRPHSLVLDLDSLLLHLRVTLDPGILLRRKHEPLLFALERRGLLIEPARVNLLIVHVRCRWPIAAGIEHRLVPLRRRLLQWLFEVLLGRPPRPVDEIL